VQGPLNLLDQLGDIVERDPRLELSEIARRNLEDLPPAGRTSARQPATDHVIDNVPERQTGATRFCFEFGGDVIIEGKGCSHVLMLGNRHHDVKDDATALGGVRPAAPGIACRRNRIVHGAARP